MKAALWRRAAQRYLLPELPGTWRTVGQAVYREPVDWLMCGLYMWTSSHSSDFYIDRFVRLLARPHPSLPGNFSIRMGLWSAPASVAEAEPIFQEITEQVREEALPFFATAGTLEGFAVEVITHTTANPLNIHMQEELTYIQLIRRDLPAAQQAARAAEHAAETDQRPWVAEVRDRVRRVMTAAEHSLDDAIAVLNEQAAATRTNLRITA